MEENPLIDLKCQTLQWRTSKALNIYALIQEYHEPTNDLIISYIQGEATEEACNVWNDTRMNKAMLFTYELFIGSNAGLVLVLLWLNSEPNRSLKLFRKKSIYL